MRKLSVALVLALVCVCVAAVATAGAKPSSGSGGKTGASAAGPGNVGAAAGYPECTPYIGEGSATICRFNQMHVEWSSSCSFTPRSENCGGTADRGSFPWGTAATAQSPRVSGSWRPSGGGDGRKLTMSSYAKSYGEPLAAQLTGFVPGSGSGDYTIEDAIAVNDLGGTNGDHFYTPDLPGQRAGEPGGPLYINWESHGIKRAEVTIEGYLYLKR